MDGINFTAHAPFGKTIKTLAFEVAHSGLRAGLRAAAKMPLYAEEVVMCSLLAAALPLFAALFIFSWFYEVLFLQEPRGVAL